MLKFLFKVYIYSGILLNELKVLIIQHLSSNHKKFIKKIFYSLKTTLNIKPRQKTHGTSSKSIRKRISGLRSVLRKTKSKLIRFIVKQKKLYYAMAVLSMRRDDMLLCYVRLSDAEKKSANNDREVLGIHRYHPRRYRRFSVYGNDADLQLRGGQYFSGHDVHTVLFNECVIKGYIEGVIQKGKLWSLIQVKLPPSSFGCFKKALYPIGKFHFLLMRFSMGQKFVKKAIFFGANEGYATNYFHFIVDVLPSLLLSMRAVSKRKDAKEFKVLMPVSLHPNIKLMIETVCKHFGFATVPLEQGKSYYCKMVVMSGYPSSMADALPKTVNYSVSPVLVRYVRWVLSAAFDKKADQSAPDSYYITRKNAAGASTTRHVANYQEIADELSLYQYETISAQSMTFEQQLDIFRAAKYVVFDGGASISNLIFSKNCKHILLLAMHKGTDPSMFVSFCQSLGIGISYVGGPTVEGQEFIESWQRTYKIELPYLIEALNENGMIEKEVLRDKVYG